jgi:hypothetical protein
VFLDAVVANRLRAYDHAMTCDLHRPGNDEDFDFFSPPSSSDTVHPCVFSVLSPEVAQLSSAGACAICTHFGDRIVAVRTFVANQATNTASEFAGTPKLLLHKIFRMPIVYLMLSGKLSALSSSHCALDYYFVIRILDSFGSVRN